MNRIACVTGADRGLGLSLTRWLLEHGFTVFAGRYMQEWEELDQLKRIYPQKLELVALDVGNADSVEQAAAAIGDKAPHLDLIINNAGITKATDQATVEGDLDFDSMMQIYNVNTLGALRVSHA